MSNKITLLTPFLNTNILLEALERENCKCEYKQNIIMTNIKNTYSGYQYFNLNKNNQWAFIYEEEDKVAAQSFLRNLEYTYKKIIVEKEEKQRLEQELKLKQELERIEAEKRAYVEARKQEIINKAKANGYYVTEKKIDKKVQLVLVRHV